MTLHMLRTASCVMLLAAASGCAGVPAGQGQLAVATGPHAPATPMSQQAAAAALLAGDTAGAVRGFGDDVARNPMDGDRQTLLALAYHQAAGGDPEQLDVAAAGYDLALRGDPNAFWAAALAGKAAYDRGRYAQAESYFARAVLMRPDDSRALLALGVSAYMAGDPQLAALGGERAAALSADGAVKRDGLRLAALSQAAGGHGEVAKLRLAAYRVIAPDEAPALTNRVNDLIRTSGADPLQAPLEGPEATAPDQVSVDVAIILSQTSQRDTVGLNLLDGLQAQYGYQNQSSESSPGGGLTRTVTDAITIPQLTYNLNLFNRFGQSYQVVARPMLTAYRGEPADFFVGRSAKVAISGVNFSQLENIDIGTNVKVTPIEIGGGRTKLHIEVTRSFLSAEPAGNFNESVNTWRQTVNTTVEVGFGKTLILSGLSESVRDSSRSKTPMLGDTPLVGSMFNKRIATDRRDAVLILVTPAPVQTFDARPWGRPADVERLIGLWSTVVAPGSDLATITEHLEHARLFTRARKDDARLTWPELPRDQGEIVKDLLVP